MRVTEGLMPPQKADAFGVLPDRDLLKQRSVRGAAATMGAQGIRFVLQFGTQIVLAHLLVPSQFGLVAMAAPVMSLVQIFNDLGLSQATVQKAQIGQNELSALFWLNLAVSLALALMMAAAAPAIAWFYHAPHLAPIVIASAALLVLSGGAAQQIALLNRRMQFTVLAAMDVACVAVAAVCGLVAALAGLGAWSLVIMQAGNSLTILILAWISSAWLPSLPRFCGADVRPLLHFGGHLTGFNMLAYAEGNLGSVLIGRLGGAVALGFYDRAYKLVIVPWWQVSLPVARVAVSLLSRLAGAERDYSIAWRRMFQGLLLVAAPGLLWSALLSDSLVPAVLGTVWRSCAPLVTDLSLATMLVPFGASAYWLFVSQGRVREQLRYAMATGFALVLSAAIGVHWGALGVARCYAMFAVFVQIWPLWGATRSGPVGRALAWNATWPMAIGLAAAAAVVDSSFALLQHSGIPVDAQLALLLVASYTTFCATLRTFPAGTSVLQDVWSLRGMIQPK